MKKYLFIALAALGFAACAENGEQNAPVQKGELEQSYVAITLAADDITRANDGGYAAGLAEERAVKSAYVFFFYDNGDAFTVASKSSHPGDVNFVSLMDEINTTPNNPNGDRMDNVSDIKDAVLVLENYKGEYPAQVVAVINWQPQNKAYSLTDLKAEISALGNATDGFVMSNAVYADNSNQVINTVALTAANISKTEDGALANPVTIHVERVAAKVVFKSVNTGLFEVGEIKDTVGSATTPTPTTVYAQIVGFELYNDYQKSYLIKRIDETWNVGFNWNDPNFFRSYWAESLDTDFVNNTFDWNNNNTAIDGYVYCGENTRTWSEANDVRTKVIVKAQLVDNNGDALTVVSWWGKDYIGMDNLKTVVANTLANTYFAGEGGHYNSLAPEHITCVAPTPGKAEAYEVNFQLSDTGADKEWYKYNNGTYEPITDDELNAILLDMQPARVYTNGMTYYWLDIEHLGAVNTTAEYGVVRNHVYNVNITDIDGFGTPVYNGDTDFIVPEKPDPITSYVSAQINILSWKVVNGDYDLN